MRWIYWFFSGVCLNVARFAYIFICRFEMYLNDFAFDERERERKKNIPTDDWRIKNKQMTAINIKNQSNDIRYNGIHLKFHMKLAPWSAFASHIFVVRSTPPLRDSNRKYIELFVRANVPFKLYYTRCEHGKKSRIHFRTIDFSITLCKRLKLSVVG